MRLPSCEGSGLKPVRSRQTDIDNLSPFLRREWIETLNPKATHDTAEGLPSCEGSGLKHTTDVIVDQVEFVSLLAKGVD